MSSCLKDEQKLQLLTNLHRQEFKLLVSSIEILSIEDEYVAFFLVLAAHSGQYGDEENEEAGCGIHDVHCMRILADMLGRLGRTDDVAMVTYLR